MSPHRRVINADAVLHSTRIPVAESLETRRMLSVADIDLANLIGHAAGSSTQTRGIVDSAGNHFEFVTVWQKPDEDTPEQPFTYAHKLSSTGDLIWSKQVGSGATVQDAFVGPGGELWATGTIYSHLYGTDGIFVWRGGDTGVWRDSIGNRSWSYGDLVLDSEGNALLTGATGASNPDAFVTKFDPSGKQRWSAFVRGSGSEKSNAVAVTGSGEVVIAGVTNSSDLEQSLNAPGDGRFIARIDTSGALIWSAYLQGNDETWIRPLLDFPVIRGTSGSDEIRISAVPSGLQPTVNGVAGEVIGSCEFLTVIGLQGNDQIIVSPGVTVGLGIYGGDGNDRIIGGSGADEIHGGDGDDWIAGIDGADTIYGDAGDDRVFGGPGADSILLGDGNDLCYAGRDDDVVLGGMGRDIVVGDGGDDLIYGDDGFDVINGGSGNDSIYGGNGCDHLMGVAGDDFIDGGAESDRLYGGPDNDSLMGGDGRDTLWGGMGNDTLEGGAGRDVMLGEVGDDSIDSSGDGARDVVRGDAGVDHLRRDSVDSVLDEIEENLLV